MKSYTATHIYIAELGAEDEDRLDDFYDWCSDTFEDDNWIVDEGDLFTNTMFKFTTEAARNWFVLRFSS